MVFYMLFAKRGNEVKSFIIYLICVCIIFYSNICAFAFEQVFQ